MHDSESAVPAADLLSSLDELRSPGNIVLAVVAGIASLGLLSGAVAMLAHGHGLLALLVALLAWLIGQTGYCAVTLRGLQATAGAAPMGLVAELPGGFAAALRMLLALLLLLAALLVIAIVAALLFVVTQIPGIGPALNFVLFPLLALLLGVCLYALLFIAVPLSAVTACDGRSVLGIVATVVLVIRKRIVDTALRGILVGLLAVFVIGLAGTIVSMGIGAAGGIKSAVAIGHAQHAPMGYGAFGNDSEFRGGFNPGLAAVMLGGGAGIGHLLGALRSVGISSIALYFVAMSLGMVVYAGGWVRIFNGGLRALDPAALEAQLREQKEKLQKAAREAQDKAVQIAKEQRDKRASSGSDDPPSGT